MSSQNELHNLLEMYRRQTIKNAKGILDDEKHKYLHDEFENLLYYMQQASVADLLTALAFQKLGELRGDWRLQEGCILGTDYKMTVNDQIVPSFDALNDFSVEIEQKMTVEERKQYDAVLSEFRDLDAVNIVDARKQYQISVQGVNYIVTIKKVEF